MAAASQGQPPRSDCDQPWRTGHLGPHFIAASRLNCWSAGAGDPGRGRRTRTPLGCGAELRAGQPRQSRASPPGACPSWRPGPRPPPRSRARSVASRHRCASSPGASTRRVWTTTPLVPGTGAAPPAPQKKQRKALSVEPGPASPRCANSSVVRAPDDPAWTLRPWGRPAPTELRGSPQLAIPGSLRRLLLERAFLWLACVLRGRCPGPGSRGGDVGSTSNRSGRSVRRMVYILGIASPNRRPGPGPPPPPPLPPPILSAAAELLVPARRKRRDRSRSLGLRVRPTSAATLRAVTRTQMVRMAIAGEGEVSGLEALCWFTAVARTVTS